ncbi:MAG: SUMF1/EgtB/PvdO family nonheme iron enzyme, partial [Ardenticatenaceae bacterium]
RNPQFFIPQSAIRNPQFFLGGPMIGSQIGHYEIIEKLGEGGMGAVYRAKDPNAFGREVAVKVLPGQFLNKPEFEARFKREARIIVAVEHPAIVPVYHFGEDKGQRFIVMRLMKGGSLADRLEQGPLPVAEIARILAILTPALDKIHKQKIIHRDLKPSNILFDEDDTPYIADFGLAKLAEATHHLTKSNLFMGTLAYMSPEQARDASKVDRPSDIYSLGAIVFEMLTGEHPYHEAHPMALPNFHMNEPVPRLDQLRTALPAGWQELIDCAMAKKPEERYATAGALSDAVQELVRGAPKGSAASQPSAVLPPPTPSAAQKKAGQADVPVTPIRVTIPITQPLPALEGDKKEGLPPPFDTSASSVHRKLRAPLPAPIPRPQAARGEALRVGVGTVLAKEPARMQGPIGMALLAVLLLFLGCGMSYLVRVNPDMAGFVANFSPSVSSPTATATAMGNREGLPLLPTFTPIALGNREGLPLQPTFTPTGTGNREGLPLQPTFTPTTPTFETRVSEIDGMTQVYVPAGEFLMGSLKSDAKAYPDEKPQRTVDLPEFWIDQTEVTNGMYQGCVEDGGCEAPRETTSWRRRERYYGEREFADYPVIYVSWHDASAYCEWAGRRLPTEAEWEKAARGTDGRRYPWGNDQPTGDLLNFNYVVADTTRVGRYEGVYSPYGALDMAGNVWEWVADAYQNPAQPEEDQEDEESELKVLRGGSWSVNNPRHLRAANRGQDKASDTDIDRGFRCASDP